MCKFFNTGYCKYILRGCKFTHPAEICSSYPCRNKRCNERHPKKCKYKQNCWFGKKCYYLHDSKEDTHSNFETNNEERNIKDSIDQLMKANNQLLKQIKEKTEYIKI